MAENKKRKQNSRNKRKQTISKIEKLDTKDKILFDNFKENLQIELEDLTAGTMDSLENIEEYLLDVHEKNFKLSKNQLISVCDELIKNESLSFSEKRQLFFKTTNFIKELDGVMALEQKKMVNQMDLYTKNKGIEFQNNLSILVQSIIQSNSDNLTNTAKIYMDMIIPIKLRILNNIIKYVFDYIKENSTKNLDIVAGTQFMKYCEIFYSDIEIKKHMLEISQMFFEGNYKSKIIKQKLKEISKIDEAININDVAKDVATIGDALQTTTIKFKKYEKEKHYDFKELEEIALDNGYRFVRCKGDHCIYRNEDKKHSIPIPKRTIGTGLSIAIKKELLRDI